MTDPTVRELDLKIAALQANQNRQDHMIEGIGEQIKEGLDKLSLKIDSLPFVTMAHYKSDLRIRATEELMMRESIKSLKRFFIFFMSTIITMFITVMVSILLKGLSA